MRDLKRSLFLCVVLLVVMGVVAAAIPLCDYSSPRTDLSDLTVDFAYHYHNDPYGLSERDIDEGQLQIDYTHHFDSPDFGFDAAVKNDMKISTSALSAFLVTAEGDLKRYFTADAPYFGFAGASAKSASSYETIGLFVKLGVGYGRFIDVTPLAKAMKIDAYLLGKGSISDHLEGIDLQAIAHEIDNIDTYDSLSDLLKVLGQIIEGSGFVKEGGLDALDAYEMAQIIEDNRHTRYCGGSVNMGIGYEILDPMKGPHDILATASFNYAFTTTPQAQLLVKGNFSGAYEILRTNQIDVTACYDYVISDRLSLSLVYSFSRETWDGIPTDKHSLAFDILLTPVEGAQVSLGARFGHEPYFLEWSQDITFQIGMKLL